METYFLVPSNLYIRIRECATNSEKESLDKMNAQIKTEHTSKSSKKPKSLSKPFEPSYGEVEQPEDSDESDDDDIGHLLRK